MKCLPYGDGLPSRSHRLLLTAALSDGAEALDAWRCWSDEFGLDSVNTEGFWLLPLLYRNLAAEGLQDREKQRLAGVYKQMRLANSISLPQLEAAANSLQRAGIDIIYGAITALFLMDIDSAIPISPIELLVPAGSLETADHLLQSQNWEPQMPLPQAHLRPFVTGVSYHHREGGDLRLNWRPFGPDCLLDQDESFWHRATDQQAGSATQGLANPLDLLLMACRDKPLLQIAVLMNRLAAEIDWGEAKSRSRELGMQHEWLALAGATPPELIHGVAAPIVRGNVDLKARSQPDDSVSLRRLAGRHWRRFHCCRISARPSSYSGYLVSYYRYTWQTGSWPAVLRAAIKKAFGRLSQ